MTLSLTTHQRADVTHLIKLTLTTLLMYSRWNVSPTPGLLLLLTVSGESPLDNLSAILFTAELRIHDINRGKL